MRNKVRLRGVSFPVHESPQRCTPSEPRFGAVSPADTHPAVAMRERNEVLRGFRSQELRLEIDSVPVQFTTATSSDGRFPFAHPVLLVSTSVREYVPWPREVNGLDFLRATAIAADRQWLDRMLILRDLPEAREVARQYGGRYAVLWEKVAMSVIDLETSQVMTRFLVRGQALALRSCPMIPGAVPGDRCAMYSRPWEPHSAVASGYWMDRRFLYESELGCDESCPPPSARHRVELPTRYFTWLWPSEVDRRWEDLVDNVRSH